MKKLIALIAGTAVMLSMSMTSFAAFDTEIKANDDGTYTAALAADAATANAGKQTTIVAYKGDAIEVGSIQYINQDAADSFTFQLKDALTADVKVVMGGEAIAKQEIGTIKYAEAKKATISGSVSNFVSADTIAGLNEWYVDVWGDETVADFEAGYAVTAYLATEEALDSIVEFAWGGESFDYIDSQVVSAEDGSYSFEVEEDGTYIVVLASGNALAWAEYAIVADGESVAFDAVDLYKGDVEKDGLIGGADALLILNNMVDLESEEFNSAYDLDPDGLIGGADALIALSNMVDVTEYGTSFGDNNY